MLHTMHIWYLLSRITCVEYARATYIHPQHPPHTCTTHARTHSRSFPPSRAYSREHTAALLAKPVDYIVSFEAALKQYINDNLRGAAHPLGEEAVEEEEEDGLAKSTDASVFTDTR